MIERILPKILATLTGVPRGKVIAGVDFEWQIDIVFNLFRLWEVIFWRRLEQRRESAVAAAMDENGKITITRQFFTLESALYFAEISFIEFVKNPFKKIPKLKFVMVPVLQMETPEGFRLPAVKVPYLFAIGYEEINSTGDGSVGTTSLTVALTTTGSARWLGCGGYTATIVTATYHLILMTLVRHKDVGGAAPIDMYGLANPDTGSSYNAVVTFSATQGCVWIATCYSGVNQTSPIDSSASGDSGGGFTTGQTISTTVVAPSCWLVGLFHNDQNATINAASGTKRVSTSSGFQADMWSDSNGTVGTGSQSLSSSHTSGRCGGIVASIAVFVPSAIILPFRIGIAPMRASNY